MFKIIRFAREYTGHIMYTSIFGTTYIAKTFRPDKYSVSYCCDAPEMGLGNLLE
jgi:hypothetical protein